MTDTFGRTELHYAVLQGELDRICELLGQGADPDVTDDQGFTPLHFAAQEYKPDAAALLLENGAMVDSRNGVGNTPLGLAVFNSQGRGEVIGVLLGAGADPDRANNAGVSPRVLAKRIANYDVKQFIR